MVNWYETEYPLRFDTEELIVMVVYEMQGELQ
jgi:hypothetical protein